MKLPHVNSGDYKGPPVKVAVNRRDSRPVTHTVEISVTTNTGGWTLALDEHHVINGVAKAFLTLERPADDEMVTQSLVTLRETFWTVEAPKGVEVYVHLAQRGVQTLTTDYRRAATLRID